MPSLKDLRNRIDSVKSTKKITQAMKMVAASKLKKAQSFDEKGRSYSLGMDSIVRDDVATEETPKQKNINSNDNFLHYLNKVNSIISKLEVLENEKSNLKDQLKNYEQEFIYKKKKTEDKIDSMIQKKEMLEKTITVIKNLKNF